MIWDCLIVGGGPAGLTAAIYAARFRLSTLVVDAGASRARAIPRSHNHAGFPGGIEGETLVERMGEQARQFGAQIRRQTVTSLQRQESGFLARTAQERLQARAVIVATGVVNHRPLMDLATHDAALASGALRYCPVCDGYEAMDQEIGVVGSGERAVREAIFLRSYSSRVAVVRAQGGELPPEAPAELAAADVRLIGGEARDFRLEDGRLSFVADQGRLAFDAVYPAMGSSVRSDLAREAGAAVSEDGCICVDAHQHTSVEALYAAGDVVLGLDQISHAMGQAGVAATTLRNELAQRRPIRR
ncbi:MAG TPA: NAD(P)/FAD-dependent oxidoreductase [Caulobacteraceae bacterium]|nr:NAD(P)/FAD-dependent oxidoreductase [Caulobacteraceae bacterium]